MPRPPSTPASAAAIRTPLLLCCLLVILFASARADGPTKPRKPGDPTVSIPLDDLGFETPQPRLLTGGATMFTVNFVDETHLLVTFNYHGLIPREADGSSQQDDRLVAGLLVELPSGKILAGTHWHMRDHEQYLWPLCHGLFLLRIGTRLTILDPVRNLRSNDAFHQQTFLDMGRRIGYVSVSPGGELLVIETRPDPVQPDEAASVAAVSATQGGPQVTVQTTRSRPGNSSDMVEIHIFRMLQESEPDQPLHIIAQSSGLVLSRNLVRVPATAEGFLDISKESRQTWLFDFQSHAGKRIELSPFDTTCAPSPWFISRSEFVAFGCHGGADRLEFSGFNLRGEEPWIQILSGNQIAPFIISAPAAGRLAFSRILVGGSFYDVDNLTPEEMTAQEIQILQSHDGRQLLKVQASPIQRTGQNFDLSPSGLAFTVIRNGNLEVYRLPPLTPKDQDQIKLAESAIPEKNNAIIRLKPVGPNTSPSPTADVAANAPAAAQSNAQPAPATSPAMSDAPIPSNPVDIVNALALPPDKPAAQAAPPPLPDEPRAPPTLYTPEHPKSPEQ
jgi:hypothetical protein